MMPALGKFCPRGWRERESPPPAQRLAVGAPPPGQRTGSARSSSPLPTAVVSSRGELRRLLPGAADLGWKLPARGEGARVPGAGRRCLLAPSPEWMVRGSSKGAVSSSPRGPPYKLRPLPDGPPGARARGFSATRCPGPILLKPLLPRRTGGGGGSRERTVSPSQRRPFCWRRLGLHPGGSRRGHCFQDAREQRRGGHARRLPPPPGLAGARAAAAGGAHVGCRALARRLRPGRIPSRSCSRSPGMWGCDCYSTFRRRVSALLLRLRLALSPAWPRGMPPGRSADVTAMLCTSSPPLPFTLPLWSPLVAPERRMRGRLPRFLPAGPSSAPPPSPPPSPCVYNS
nr:wiskott-Aldrich syndrome protein homolog 1 [Macaca fascicularis]